MDNDASASFCLMYGAPSRFFPLESRASVGRRGQHLLRSPLLLQCRPELPLLNSAPSEPQVPISQHYSGEVGRYGSFLLQCSVVCDLQLLTCTTGRANIAFLCNFLSGRASQSATTITENQKLASVHFNC